MSFIHKILPLLRPYRLETVLTIFFNFLSSLFGIVSLSFVIPFLRILFEDAGASGDSLEEQAGKGGWQTVIMTRLEEYLAGYSNKSEALLAVCISVVVVFLIKNIFYYLSRYYLAILRNGIVRDLRSRLIDKTMLLSQNFLLNHRRGDLLSRFSSDLGEIEWGVMGFLEVIFKEPFNVLLLLGTLIYISPTLSLIVLFILPLTGFIIARIAKSLKKDSYLAQEQQGYLVALAEEILGGIRIIRSFGAEKMVGNYFKEENQRYFQAVNRILWKRDLSSPLSEFLAIMAITLILYTGGRMVLKEEIITAESFIFYIVIFSQIIAPAKALTTGWYYIQKGMASLNRVEEMMKWEESEYSESIQLLSSADSAPLKFIEKITFQHLSFAYDGRIVLDDISIELCRGRVIALVGPSGSGKTTLIDMLLRFQKPASGAVFLDGKDAHSIPLSRWRSLFALVSQDPILFHQTIYQNIAMGRAGAGREEVIAAAEIANAHSFIMQQEKGYDTVIGDRGLKLSGGERQRITIARAILKNAPILLLDEATSALDAGSEQAVQEAIERVMENRTVLIIAHRLATIHKADEIIFLRQGKIIEQGTHRQLMEIGGEYSRMVKLQEL